MITLRGTQYHYWRNRYAEQPVLAMELDLGGAQSWRADALPPPVAEALDGKFEGFGKELAGRDAASLTAALALKIQSMNDQVASISGVHSDGSDGTRATAFFACMDPHLGNVTVWLAIRLANALIGEPAVTTGRLAAILGRIEDRITASGLDQSTRAMVAAATRKGIPWFRLINTSCHIQLGQGHKQRQIRETLRSGESGIALELAANKFLTSVLLNAVQLPVGRVALVSDADSALKSAQQIGYPIVLKPVAGHKGDSVFAGLKNAEELEQALAAVPLKRRPFLLQSSFPGDDHRLLVVSGRLIAAARRHPASVIGDGTHTIGELVEEANKDPRRGRGFTKITNRIEIDGEALRVLSHQGFALDDIPAEGVTVRLRATANVATGGTAVDVTEAVHPHNAEAAIKAAKALGLQVAGVDFLSPDISRSWREIGGGICEVNSVVGLQPHWLGNPERDVVRPILETIFPPGDNGRIPTAMTTGTKGKSSTSLMLSTILNCAGHTVGTATTDGVIVGGTMIGRGDAAAVSGTEAVFRDPTVTAAVLETARGGLIMRGMYVESCEAAALLNIQREQIEMDGIETLDDMARLKRKVLEAAKRAIVLNADDPRSAGMARDFPSVRKIFFSLRGETSGGQPYIREQDTAIFVGAIGDREFILLERDADRTALVAVDELPSGMGGLVRHNIANAMAAAGLALGLGISLETIADGLRRYDNSIEQSYGRFSFVAGFPMRVLFDRAVEPPAFETVTAAIDKIIASGRRICALTGVGNRPTWHWPEVATAIAGHFDFYVCYERPEYLRGKRPGEIAEGLAHALIAAGVRPDCIVGAPTSREAAAIIARKAQAEDLVVIFGSDITTSVQEYREAFNRIAELR